MNFPALPLGNITKFIFVKNIQIEHDDEAIEITKE